MTQPDTATSLMLQAIEQISAMQGSLGVLQGQCNIIIKEQHEAADSRQRMYDRLHEVEMLMTTVKRIAPMVDSHEQRYQQGQGAAWAMKTLWGAIAGGGGAALVLIARKLGFIT